MGTGRHLRAPEGVRLRRMRRFDDRVQWNLGPPRVRYDEAVLDVAADSASDLDDRGRLARKPWLCAVLDGIAAGTCSVLERAAARLRAGLRTALRDGCPVGRGAAQPRLAPSGRGLPALHGHAARRHGPGLVTAGP